MLLLVSMYSVSILTVPFVCQHDVVFVKLLPAEVLPRASPVIAVSVPRLLLTDGGTEPIAAF